MPGGGKGGSSSTSTVNVTNGPVSVDSDSTVEIAGLNDIKVTAIVPQPIRTESRQELVLPQPLQTESSNDTRLETKAEVASTSALSVDLKPVALDVCMTSSTKLPQGQIYQPFNYHFGLTWLGMELFGFNFGGESRMILEDLPRKPAVEWPAQQNAAPAAPRHAGSPPTQDQRGLRIRIK